MVCFVLLGAALGQQVDLDRSVGAGDTFFSAALTYLYENDILSDRRNISKMTPANLNDCLAFAARAAAINCTRKGANPPFRDEMEE